MAIVLIGVENNLDGSFDIHSELSETFKSTTPLSVAILIGSKLKNEILKEHLGTEYRMF